MTVNCSISFWRSSISWWVVFISSVAARWSLGGAGWRRFSGRGRGWLMSSVGCAKEKLAKFSASNVLGS